MHYSMSEPSISQPGNEVNNGLEGVELDNQHLAPSDVQVINIHPIRRQNVRIDTYTIHVYRERLDTLILFSYLYRILFVLAIVPFIVSLILHIMYDIPFKSPYTQTQCTYTNYTVVEYSCCNYRQNCGSSFVINTYYTFGTNSTYTLYVQDTCGCKINSEQCVLDTKYVHQLGSQFTCYFIASDPVGTITFTDDSTGPYNMFFKIMWLILIMFTVLAIWSKTELWLMRNSQGFRNIFYKGLPPANRFDYVNGVRR